MIPPIALPVISRILNQYLRLDAEMQSRLKKYHGKVIRFTISSIDWTFFIEIDHEKLILKPESEKPIDAGLKATITDLAQNAFDEKASISKALELSGDTALLQAITNIFKNVEIDWEELVSKYTGDTLAHCLGNFVRDIKSFHDNLFDTKKLNIKEYLQEEINLLVHPYAVDDFCKDVDEFRDQVERLSVKIQFIENNIEKD